ncbi:MAG: c-type cytochrome [Gammaproteobacteria bacterium]|nr:c-type cytochrome [Gammaproteobacteria bacterium]
MPFEFWSWWVAILTLTSLFGLGWVTYSAYFSADRRAKADEEGAQSDTVWDQNLREGGRPAPIWWFWLLLSLLVASVVYLMLYPGLGVFQGALNWSSDHRLSNRMMAYEMTFGPKREAVLAMNYSELQADADLMKKAERLFGEHCAACHGLDARGQANRFPNLTDSEWIWGGTIGDIDKTIREGRAATMTGWADSFSEDELNLMTDLVLDMNRGESVEALPIKPLYEVSCAACHESDGTGNPLLGAPDLTNDIHLYGSDRASIKYTIAHGRNGEMPAFNVLLDDTEIKLLVAWITKNRE